MYTNCTFTCIDSHTREGTGGSREGGGGRERTEGGQRSEDGVHVS